MKIFWTVLTFVFRQAYNLYKKRNEALKSQKDVKVDDKTKEKAKINNIAKGSQSSVKATNNMEEIKKRKINTNERIAVLQ